MLENPKIDHDKTSSVDNVPGELFHMLVNLVPPVFGTNSQGHRLLADFHVIIDGSLGLRRNFQSDDTAYHH